VVRKPAQPACYDQAKNRYRQTGRGKMRAVIARVFGRKSPVEHNLAAMEGLDDLPTLQAMKSVVEWLGRQGAEHEAGPEVLVAMDGKLRALLERACCDVQDAHLSFARLAVLLQSINLFCSDVLSAYGAALRHGAGKMSGKPAQITLVKEAACNWLFWSSRDYIIRHLRKTPCEALPWGEILSISRFITDTASQAGADTSKTATFDLQLAHLLLLSRSITPSLQGRMLLIADKIALSLAGFVALDSRASDATPHALAPDGLAAATLLPNRATGRSLYYGLERALQELAALEKIVQTQHCVPQSLDPQRQLGAPEVLATIKHLHISWSARQVKRIAQRKSAAGHLKAAHGFDTVRRLLMRHDQVEIENLSLESANRADLRVEALISQQEQQVQAPSEIIDAAQGTPVERCEVQDISSNGLGFKLPLQRDWAQVGQLVCVSAENRNAWLLVMIRRVCSAEQNEVKIGSELLSRKPEAVQLSEWRSAQGAGTAVSTESSEYRWALYAPFETSAGPMHLLICSRPGLKPSSYYAADDSTMGKIAFLIIEQHELGTDSISYRCKPVAMVG